MIHRRKEGGNSIKKDEKVFIGDVLSRNKLILLQYQTLIRTFQIQRITEITKDFILLIMINNGIR